MPTLEENEVQALDPEEQAMVEKIADLFDPSLLGRGT